MIRYACIGAGGIARKKHLQGYSRLPQVELAAICDTNRAAAEALAREYGIPRVYTDYRELLQVEKPDLVSICTPNVTHKDITIAALEQGACVHVEKPMTMNAAEAREVLEAQKRTGKLVQVGLNKRFTSAAVLLRRLLEAGYFGEIYHVRCGWERNSGIPGTGRWFTNRALSGGGALIDLGVHYLDLGMLAMGWPEPEKAVGALSDCFLDGGGRIRRGYRSADGVNDVEDSAAGVVRMKDGKLLEYAFRWAANIQKETQYVQGLGTKAGFRLEDDSLVLYTQLGGTMFRMLPDEKTLPEPENECESVICAMEGSSPCRAPAEEGARIMELIDLIYGASGQWIA